MVRGFIRWFLKFIFLVRLFLAVFIHVLAINISDQPTHPTMERGRTMSRISVPKGAANFRGRKSNSLMNLCGKLFVSDGVSPSIVVLL